MGETPEGITQLLIDWRNGDKVALDHLIPLVYDELRRMAKHYLAKQRRNHTLQTSALINEAYLRLVNQETINWQNRAHFFAVAAQIMRHILIDYARSYRCEKRGGGAYKLALEDALVFTEERAAELVALDDALKMLAALDLRANQIIEMRFFGGLSIEETAEVLNVSPTTVQREWRAAKAWLQRFISGNHPAENS